MSEVISIQFPDISGDATDFTAFLRSEAGALLNTGGDEIAETGTTGLWTFTLAETRVALANYHVRIYSGTAETPANLVYDGVLYAGQTLVDRPSGDIVAALANGTQVFGHSYLECFKRTEMASGAATLSGAGSGTEVMTSADASKTATFTVDDDGNVSAVVWT